MNDATFCLSQDASIQAHLEIAKKAIASGENDLRRAAEHIAEAHKQGASQRRIAAAIGKSVSTVNRYLNWHDSGFRDETPFGPESKAKRQRARVRATERTNSGKRSRGEVAQDELAAALARAQAAQADAARARAEAIRATDEAMRAKAEAVRERLRSGRADPSHSTATAPRHPLDRRQRDLLVKALGMLGSDQVGERAAAALIAEKQRSKLGMTWDELVVNDQDGCDLDEDELDDDDELDDEDEDRDWKCHEAGEQPN
ncbi:helix-turn-helix domain-containing protein [Bradyrhizobium sp. MOS001]|uniref:helix-turn-helix domain-containing protein n=1 Tax=Bradyrhizobium sp. MOS001 TaxID=2133948 RepID=UPI0010749FB3|nr:helix-turn-helix domain-containing protein [Bradyrhizobium sp. MOS001]TFW56898.1 helix-turn-helix domain-containing protein [Bradyrhizobium sp. MOS001]